MKLRKQNYIFVTPDGVKDISEICEAYDAKTLLDYGCGLTYLNIPGVTVDRYDPFFSDCDIFPTGKYDIVVCHNSLNHVELTDLKQTISGIYELTNRSLVVNIQFPGKNKVKTTEYVQAFEDAGFVIKELTRTHLTEFEKLINVNLTSINPNWTIAPAVLYFLLEKGTQCSSN